MTIGDSVPAVTVQTMAGAPLTIGPGRVTLVNLWATWCESCREEMNDLAAIAHDYGARGLQVTAISEDDGDTARVGRFLRDTKLDLPVVIDPDGRARTSYQAVALPESYLISADGHLLWRQQGGIHGDVAAARAAIAHALGTD